MKTTIRRKHWTKIVIGALVLFTFLNNTSLFQSDTDAEPFLIAHRGMAQDFDREGLTGETCTADRMTDTGHEYLENTIESMEAAFAAGADMVEFDVHKTTDGRFAIFHDWTLDCRTDGTGITREHSLAELQTLDIGFGYTADKGQTHPFRGRGSGLLPSLEQVFTTFPDKDFVIDIKSNDEAEGELLAERIQILSAGRSGHIMVYGGNRPVSVIQRHLPNVHTITRPRLKNCLVRYMLLGWTGYIPGACGSSMIMVPENIAPWLWGWPHRFVKRMERVNSRVLLFGEYRGEGFSQGFDDPARVDEIPDNYAGGIWTDRIELIAPAIDNRLLNR